MDKSITDGYKKIREDLQAEFSSNPALKGAKVGDRYNPPDPTKTDYVVEDFQFKFKIYLHNNSYMIVRAFEEIQDYPTSGSGDKRKFIKDIVSELLQAIN